MIPVAQRPTGNPGSSPTGPAGPTPSGPAGPRPAPTTPRPDQQAPPPASPKQLLDLDLAHAEVVLLGLGLLSRDRLGALDPALHMQFNSGLRTALRAVSAAQNSGRGGKAASAESRPVQLATAETSDPARAEVGAATVAIPAGRPPASGGDFLLPTQPRPPEFIGVANYDALVKANRSG